MTLENCVRLNDRRRGRGGYLRLLVVDYNDPAVQLVLNSQLHAHVLAVTGSLSQIPDLNLIEGFEADVFIAGRTTFQELALRRGDSGAAGNPDCSASIVAQKVRHVPHQEELLASLYKGLRNSEIASHLGIATRTVKAYLSELYAIFDVTNRTELVGSAVEQGLLKTERDAED